MDSGSRRSVSSCLREKAVAIQGRPKNHCDFAFGARTGQDLLQARPDLRPGQAGPVPEVAPDAAINAAFSARSVPRLVPKRHLRWSAGAKLCEHANLLGGLAANLMQL